MTAFVQCFLRVCVGKKVSNDFSKITLKKNKRVTKFWLQLVALNIFHWSSWGFYCMSKSAAWEERMTHVSGIYEERWRKLWSLSHIKAGVPPNQTGPVTHHICPFQHAHTHRHMDVLMEGSGFLVRGCAGQRWSSFPDSMNHSLEKDGKNKNIACFSQLTRHNHTDKAPFKMSSGSFLRLLYGTRLVPGLVFLSR